MKKLQYFSVLILISVFMHLGGGYGFIKTKADHRTSSNSNFRIELIDPPTDGYEPYSDVPMRVYLNNNTGRDLSDVKVSFILKKKAKNANEDITSNGIHEYIQFKDVPAGYNQDATFVGEYATYQITKKSLGSISEQFTMRLTYPILNNYILIDDLSKLDPNWMAYGDFEFEVIFTSGDEILAKQNITLRTKPQNPTYRMTLHKDNQYTINNTPVNAKNPVNITTEKTKLLWLALSPTHGPSVSDGLKHLTFHLPDGIEFDTKRFKEHYPWLVAQVHGRDISIDVPPYTAGKFWTVGNKYRRMQTMDGYSVNPYINIPITIIGNVHTPYLFSVDGDMSASVTITDKELKQVDPKSLVKPSVSSYDTDNTWITTVHTDLNSNDQFLINSSMVDVKQPGMTLTQLYVERDAKVYGIKDDKKVELIKSKLTHDPLYYELASRSYYFVSGIEVYDKIQVTYDKPTSNIYVNYNFETTDKTKLSTKFPITYNINDGINVETSSSFTRTPIKHSLVFYNGDRNFINTTNGRLYSAYPDTNLFRTPFYGKYDTYILYKYEKDMRVTHSKYEELIKREIVGDTVYDLVKAIDFTRGTIEYQTAEFLPSMSDGVHKLMAKVFFNTNANIPINYVDVGIRQPFNHNHSLQDNYDNSTNKEHVINFTYESPKRLQVSALLDGSTQKEVTNVTPTMEFVHYISNKSTQEYENVSGEVILPKNMYLTGIPTTDNRYKFLYEENGNFVENPNNLATIRKIKIVPKTNETLRSQDLIETHMPIKFTDTIAYNDSLMIKSKMVYNGLDTKAQDIWVHVKDHTLADGKVNVNYLFEGKTIKTDMITKKHGSTYTIDTTDFTKDGKRYEIDRVDGDITGAIIGSTIKDVTVYVREKQVVFDLPTTGTVSTIIVLIGLIVLTGFAIYYRRTSK